MEFVGFGQFFPLKSGITILENKEKEPIKKD
jgi:hypothetical protein